MAQLSLVDSRRLTGPNLFSALPGAVIDVVFDNENDASNPALLDIENIWLSHARELLQQLAWAEQATFNRIYRDGVSLGITAPIDALYSATEVCEAAWQLSKAELSGQPLPDIPAIAANLSKEIAQESNPALVALQAQAQQHGVAFLCDDDVVSLGYGPNCQQWPVDQIPKSGIDWGKLSSIPLALITGTNGKSTSVRLTAAIMHAAGLQAGVTSTDYIRVGEDIIEHGDFSGPGGARTLLRDPRTEIAVLEVARGGILRRGLGVFHADAALITNVAADHLGDYGINSVPELIEAKFVVRRALSATAPLILNADDKGVVQYSERLSQPIIWFSEHADNPVIAKHIQAGGSAITLENNTITRIDSKESSSLNKTAVVDINAIPITIKGAARHNVQNALGVTGLCWALGVSDQAIATGLQTFSGSTQENPGRGNYFEAHGAKILVDYAHNEHGMNAITTLMANIPAKRRLVMMGQAGDRSNALIADLVRSAMQAKPNKVIAYEVPGYERGRQPGETPKVIADAFVANGFDKANITLQDNPLDGVRTALEWAQEGDLLLLIILTSRDEALALVQEFVSSA